MSSCPSSPLNEAEKRELRESREEQLRELYREAIVRDLLQIYTTPSAVHGKNLVDELLENMDRALDINRKRIFISVLKESIPILEGACDVDEKNNRV